MSELVWLSATQMRRKGPFRSRRPNRKVSTPCRHSHRIFLHHLDHRAGISPDAATRLQWLITPIG
jgi:hypothetical protein